MNEPIKESEFQYPGFRITRIHLSSGPWLVCFWPDDLRQVGVGIRGDCLEQAKEIAKQGYEPCEQWFKTVARLYGMAKGWSYEL